MGGFYFGKPAKVNTQKQTETKKEEVKK